MMREDLPGTYSYIIQLLWFDVFLQEKRENDKKTFANGRWHAVGI